MRAGYDLDYTHFAERMSTAPDVRRAGGQVAHGAPRWRSTGSAPGGRVGLVGACAAQRLARLGRGDAQSELVSVGDHRPNSGTFSATAPRSAALDRALAAARRRASRRRAWRGSDLDRFSRYSFGTLRQPPARLSVGADPLRSRRRRPRPRGVVGRPPAPARRLRSTTAFVRDPGFGRGVRNYTGVGAAVEAPAPFGTLLSPSSGATAFRGSNATAAAARRSSESPGTRVF